MFDKLKQPGRYPTDKRKLLDCKLDWSSKNIEPTCVMMIDGDERWYKLKFMNNSW